MHLITPNMQKSTSYQPTPYLLAEVLIRAIEELDAGEGARQLAAAGDPRDGRSVVKEVHRLHLLPLFFLDHAHTEDLALLLFRA